MISTVTLVCTTLFMCGLASLSTGGIVDACNQYSLAGTSKAECRNVFSAALAGKKVSEQTKSVLAFALVFPRIEASLFLGMGMGSVFALLKLKPGTADVMVIHLMQGIFFVCACGIHLHNSKLLGFEVDPNLRVDESTWMPFAIMTGLLAALSWASFFVSSKKVVEVDFVAQAEDVKAQAAAATKLQAGLRAKKVREEDSLRKRKSINATAEL